MRMDRIQKIFTNPNAVVVFVEDQLTLHYLEIIWQRELAMLNIVCAGSRDLVYEFTRNYQENKFDCWGIVDLDYNWNRSFKAQRIIRLQKHEIENYLLDSNAIYQSDFNYKKTGNNKKHSENEIETKISAFMNENRYWFACCYVLNKIKYDDFELSRPAFLKKYKQSGLIIMKNLNSLKVLECLCVKIVLDKTWWGKYYVRIQWTTYCEQEPGNIEYPEIT